MRAVVTKVVLTPTVAIVDDATGTIVAESVGTPVTMYQKQFPAFESIIRNMEKSVPEEVLNELVKSSTISEA